MNIPKSILRLSVSLLAVAVIVCSLPLLALEANAIVYSEYFSLDELKEGFASTGSQDIPIINEIKFENDRVAMYDKFEVTFSIDGTWDNPYDPDEIQVDGVFTYPSGKQVTIPAFYLTPMVASNPDQITITYANTAYNYDPEYNGKSVWCLRFSGDEVGDYSFHITVKDAEGNSSKSATQDFSCYDAGNKGYAMISESNPEYIVNSYDGTPFYGSGVNLPWVRAQFTSDPTHRSYNYFINRAKLNTNMTRVWLCCYGWLEWMPKESAADTWTYVGQGYYNQVIAASFDNVLEFCEDAGIRVILTLDDNEEQMLGNGEFGTWSYNPYNINNGGTALNSTEYWSNKGVREQYKKRLRYMIARWGYSSALFSFNMWNDMGSGITDDIVEYHQELRDYAHSLTDGWRPFLYGSNFNGAVNQTLDYTVQYVTQNDNTKPYLTQECYADGDDLRGTLRNTIWTELVQGSTASMYWSQDSVDEYNNNEGCWDVFKNILDFTSDIPLDKSGKFTSGQIKSTAATPTNPEAECQTITEIKPYGDVGGFGKKATENEFTIDTSVAGMNLHGYTSTYYGFNHKSTCKNPPTFTVDVPNGGRVMIEATASSFGHMEVTLDGKVVASQEFRSESGSMGRHDITDTQDTDGNGQPDRYTFIDLTPGTHKIKVDNISADWFSANIYFITNSETPADMLTINSMVSDSAAVVYIKNTTYSITASNLLGNTSTDFTDVAFTVEGLKEDGRYAMYQFNPDTGEYLAAKEVTVSGGKIDITLDRVNADSAIKLIKLADGETVGEGSRYTPLQLVSTSSIKDILGNEEGEDGNGNGDNGSNPGGTLWLIIAVVAVLAIGGAVAFIIIKKKKTAPKKDQPESKE